MSYFTALGSAGRTTHMSFRAAFSPEAAGAARGQRAPRCLGLKMDCIHLAPGRRRQVGGGR